MSKPPSKGEALPLANMRPPGGRTHLTRAATAATSANKVLNTKTVKESPVGKEPQGPMTESTVAENRPSNDTSHMVSTLQKIADAIALIAVKDNVDRPTRKSLDKVISFIQEEKEKERLREANLKASTEDSFLRKRIRADLVEMYNSLKKQLDSIQDTLNATLESTGKLLKDTEGVAAATRDLSGKVGKITDTADKIATDTSKYRDAVLSRPTPTPTLRANTDPKVLGDLDRKARQILVELFGTEGDSTLGKSLTDLADKANEVISEIEDSGKPKDIKVETLFKTHRQALVLVLNSKDAATWISNPEIEIAFTKAFSEGSHITARKYNLIVPRIPITFDPKDKKHLHEVEEANGLRPNEITKARWIKPTERRRLDQTHAYAIMTLSSVDSANRLIRDGMNICNARVRPTKQKREPVQCMKCRKWGHYVCECPADTDTCGTCGEPHRTNTCPNKEKIFCVSCGDKSHTSWDRTCPEFSRRCAIQDERNPENAMPFFPTEHDWTLTARPYRIPLDERFPGVYTVNSLPTLGGNHPPKGSRPPRRANGATASQNPQGRGPQRTGSNLIPLSHDREEGELSGADGHDELASDAPFYNWTKEDKEQHQLNGQKGW